MDDEFKAGEEEFDPKKIRDDDDEFTTGDEIPETEPDDETSLDAMIEDELEEEDEFSDKEDEW